RGNRSKARLQFLDLEALEVPLEAFDDPLTRDQARAGEVEIQVAEDLAFGEVAREALEFIEASGGKASPNHGADRGSGNDVRHNADLGKRPQNANVRPATRCAAAKCNPDFTASHTRLPGRPPTADAPEPLLQAP